MEVSGKLATGGQTLCDLCRIQGKHKLADGFCSDCNEYMCKDCFQVHLMPRPCRNHVLGSLDQSRSPATSGDKPEYCKIHKTETVRYYCPVHDAIACGDCTVDNHNECKMLHIRDLARNFEESTEFQDILRKVKALESETNASEKLCKKFRVEKKTLLDTALSDIRKFRKELNDFLDNAEKEIVNEANTFMRENEHTLAEIEQNIADLMSKISELKKELDPKSYQEVTLFIRYTECKSSVNDIERGLSAIKSKNTSHTITFAPDQTLKEMLKSKPKLGYLKRESQLLFRKEPARDSKYSSSETKVPSAPTQTSTEMRSATSKQANENMSKHITEAQSATPKYLPPDPRAHGFDVGTRVRWEPRNFKKPWSFLVIEVSDGFRGWKGRGEVTQVYPEGYVDVKDDYGSTVTCLYAGAKGQFEVCREE